MRTNAPQRFRISEVTPFLRCIIFRLSKLDTQAGGRRRRVAEIRRVLRKNEAAQDTAALFVVARSIGRPGSLVCARVQNPETRYLINYRFYGLVARMRKIQWMLGSLETQ